MTTPAATHGHFVHPTDVAVDDQGNVYVVDFGNERIQKFAPGSAPSGKL